ncbi:MAG: tRNA epoxyqueuosine(34) reductase QueG [Mahellales bacterium]
MEKHCSSLEDIVKRCALRAGLDLCGIAPAHPLTDIKDILFKRRQMGYTTPFEHRDIDLRCYPERLMANVRSIIVVAKGYNVPSSKRPSGAPHHPTGRFSKISRGRDYHLVMKGKVELMIEKLLGYITFDYKYYVDTGPLPEKELARKAGIGWFGKNNLIINEKLGSFMVLGHILTDLPLRADKAAVNRCGNCDRCIRACPTGAIVSPHTVNCSKCLAYLTQAKDNIPPELLDKFGNLLYGCDLCQDACPYNKKAWKNSDRDFMADEWTLDPELEAILNLTDKEFKEVFGHKACGWRGINTLKRNAIIALGNSRHPQALEILKRLRNSNPPRHLMPYIDWAVNKCFTWNNNI